MATLGTFTNRSSTRPVEMANLKIHVEFKQVFFKRCVFICCLNEFLTIKHLHMLTMFLLHPSKNTKMKYSRLLCCDNIHLSRPLFNNPRRITVYTIIEWKLMQTHQSLLNFLFIWNVRIRIGSTNSTTQPALRKLRHKHIKICIFFIFTSLTTYIVAVYKTT